MRLFCSQRKTKTMFGRNPGRKLWVERACALRCFLSLCIEISSAPKEKKHETIQKFTDFTKEALWFLPCCWCWSCLVQEID